MTRNFTHVTLQKSNFLRKYSIDSKNFMSVASKLLKKTYAKLKNFIGVASKLGPLKENVRQTQKLNVCDVKNLTSIEITLTQTFCR